MGRVGDDLIARERAAFLVTNVRDMVMRSIRVRWQDDRDRSSVYVDNAAGLDIADCVWEQAAAAADRTAKRLIGLFRCFPEDRRLP